MPTADREEALFAAALEKPTPAERAAYLDGACGADAGLRARLEALLAAHEAVGGALDAPPSGLPLTTPGTPPAEGPGTVIGPYKLLQQIGEGGMGVVYMAEQLEPVRRRVALKIIKPGLDSKQVIARFEAERQALAMMDHQNIARVLDAGTTDGSGSRQTSDFALPPAGTLASSATGRPYFVMELVHGVPITRYCDDNRLTTRERLALFVPVCQAIQHAHQKGIIHRDVKPSNVLVTMYDDKPVPKVIDFGVAKAIEQRLTDKTLFTQFGTLVGTFEYMSPEQAEMNAFGVDTRSDIYSLGVLLYELLTGTTPLERKRLRQAALDELVRLIKHEEPPRPSARLSSSNNLPKIAAARKTEPARLLNLVRGEIDWIVMKCLEKDRSRRYDTASGLARDVERYLGDEPVEACPPSARYRLSKFARKHRKALVTVAAFAILLIAGTVVSALLAVWARSAQREADKQRDQAQVLAYAYGMGFARRAWEENDVGRARELLEEVPREAAGRELRGFEWYYLNRLSHSQALTLEGQDFEAWSPNGQRLVSLGLASHTVKICDSTTGKELFSLEHGSKMINYVALSPDGNRLATMGSDGTVKIWESATGKDLFSLGDAGSSISSVAFSPDGRRLGGVSFMQTQETNGRIRRPDGGTVKIWDSATGKELLSLKGHTGPYIEFSSVAFSPDGQRLAWWDRDTKEVKISDSATGAELACFKGHRAPVHVAFSPDGQRVASGGHDEALKVWDSANGKELFSLNGYGLGITGGGRFSPNGSEVFSPDGQRLASRRDGMVTILDSVTGKELFALKVDNGCVALSPDWQRLASGGRDHLVKIWDIATSAELASLKDHTDLILRVAFSPDGQRLASGSLDNTVKIWDSDTPGGFFSRNNLRLSSVAFSPDGQRLASGSFDQTVKIWDRATGKELFSLKGHAGPFRSVPWSPDSQRLASGSNDDRVKIWDSVTGRELSSFKLSVDAGIKAFSPDGRRMGSGQSSLYNTVKISDSVTGKALFCLSSPTTRSEVYSSASALPTVAIWDLATGKALFFLNGNNSVSVSSLTFSPDGQRLASGGGDHTVRIWDGATGDELFALKGHAGAVLSVAFSPDSQRVASGGHDNTVKIWDCVSGKEVYSFKARGAVTSVAFSPDGQCLASIEGGSLVLRETVVSPEMQQRREANALVADLIQEVGFRADVLERVRTAHGLSPAVRREALAAAQTYAENALTLDDLAWNLVKSPDRTPAEYQKALRYSEAACQLEPTNAGYLNTLGVAYYRVGNYEKALATLLRSDQINKTQPQGSQPEDLAFLAMTQQRLGHAKEAQAELQRLRERMKDPRWAQDTQAQGFLREAEALLGKPAKPNGPPVP